MFSAQMNQVLEAARATGNEELVHELRAQVQYYQRLEKRWKPFLKDVEDPWKRYIMASTMENTRRELARGYREDVLVANVGSFDKFIFPIIRALFPNLAATELVSVQPMTAPVGLVFYFNYLYGTSKGEITSGDVMFENPSAQYGSETVSTEQLAASAITADVEISGTLSFTPVKPGSFTAVASKAGGTMTVTDDGAGNIIGDVGTGGTMTINYTTGAFSFSYDTLTSSTTEGTYDYDMEFNSNIPLVDIVLTKAPVVAQPRKLKSRWSLEAQQDLEALHGLNAEEEITNAITAELGFEIDLEVINDLDAVAYDATTGEVPDWNINPPPAVNWIDHVRSVKQVFLRASSTIHSRTGRAVLSWLVGGYDVINVLRDHPDWTDDAGFTHEGRGIIKAGKLGNWDVYQNPQFDTKKWLGGFKPSSFANAGYVYAPYVPVYTTPLVTLDDFGVRKGLATRYGKRTINPDFYIKGTFVEA
jgi:hypothetical protein